MGSNSYVCRSYGGKTGRGTFLLPTPPNLSRVKKVQRNQIILTHFTTALLGDIGGNANIPLVTYLSGWTVFYLFMDFTSADCTFGYLSLFSSSPHFAQMSNTRTPGEQLTNFLPSLITNESKNKYKLLNTLALNLR